MNFRAFFTTWRCGANFIPSTAVNQLEMWQAESFDPATIRRELSWGAALGMRVMRVYLHDLLYMQDASGFLRRMETYLQIADEFDILTVFVFFDDCWNSEFQLGPQPAPRVRTHNSGWIQSPGRRVADDSAQWGRLEEYVTGVMRHFAHDRRILAWDLYNEPGNGATGDHETHSGFQGKKSLPLLEAVFDWAKMVHADQPFTVGLWNLAQDFDEINHLALEQSQVVSFHCYTPQDGLQERIDFLRFLADGRPLVCTEYMARRRGSTFAACLPILKQKNVTAIHWGLVAGKTNTIYPWNWNAADGEPPQWFHDVFHADGRMLYEDERAVFEQICKNPQPDPNTNQYRN